MLARVTNLQKWPFLRFVIGGSINTLLTYALFLVLSSVLHFAIAYTIAFAAGILVSYMLAAIFVFRTGLALQSALRFPAVYVLQYLYGLGALSLMDRLGVGPQVAMLVVIATSTPLTFLLTRQVMKPGSALRM